MNRLFLVITAMMIIGLIILPAAPALALDPNTSLSSADASFTGQFASDYSGFSVSNVGDVNGDGYNDFVIGAYSAFGGAGLLDSGKTYLILGKATNWSSISLSSADVSFTGESEYDRSGWSVSGAGDVNNDGFDDFLIGAGNVDHGGFDEVGKTYLILGKPAGWSSISLSSADASFVGEAADDYSGRTVSGAGDVNGDGFDDFLIAALGNDDGGENAGKTYLILGNGAPGWGTNYDLGSANASFIGTDVSDWSGCSASGAGDVNGDGFDDFLIGAYWADGGGYSGNGQTYLIYGKSSGWTQNVVLSSADASFCGEESWDYTGSAVSEAGDVNGDGFDDILIGANMDSDGSTNAGQTYLIFGKSSPFSLDTSLSSANASFIGENAGDKSGYSISGAGDINGDGYNDIIIGATGFNSGSNTGKTYLIEGKISGWAMDTSLSTADASFIGENPDDLSGHSVSGAGDVNGDGFDDLLIGAYWNGNGGDSSGKTYMILSDASGAANGAYKNFAGNGNIPAIHYPQANVTVDFSACTSSSGYLTVTEHNNQKPEGEAANRYWSIEPTGLSSYTYDITLKYNDGEIAEAGGDESKLQLFRRVGDDWIVVAGTVNADANEIIATGQTGFSEWALGNNTNFLPPVPEIASIILLSCGLLSIAGLILYRKKHRKMMPA